MGISISAGVGTGTGTGTGVARTEQWVAVTRLSVAEVEELAGDLHRELRTWTATSTQAESDYHEEDLARMVDSATFDDRIEFRVATLDGRHAGVAVTRAGSFEGEPTTFVWWLAVDPAARRRGVARALAAAIEQDAQAHSRLLEGMVRTDDVTAVAFWTSLGWRPASTDRRAPWVRGLRAPGVPAHGPADASAVQGPEHR